MKPFTYSMSCLIALAVCLLSNVAVAQESYSPHASTSFPNQVYWGDTHVHTNLSSDVGLFGATLTPEHAYRFAKGERLRASNGMAVRLQRPLDFIVVADHAFNLGVAASIESADPKLLSTLSGRRLYQQWKKIQEISDPLLRSNELGQLVLGRLLPIGGDDRTALGSQLQAVDDDIYNKSIWQQVTANADRHNNPGKFTAFIGYEWTSRRKMIDDPYMSTRHRNVIFKDGAEKANTILPFSAFDSHNPEDLWQFLESYQRATGGDVLAIPHNANFSNGQEFSLVDFEGHPLSRRYAKTRSRWEPLYEVTQNKGDTETHPVLSPLDDFANFERWNGRFQGGADETKVARQRFEYARSALKLGLDQKAKLGVNPFMFGMIGSSDTHNSLSAVDEDNFFGSTPSSEPNPERIFQKFLNHRYWALSSSGYAGVWAEENTRDSLFSAMRRKEVYATTGPRISVRFFGGWQFDKKDSAKPDLAQVGYKKGVPMGGELTQAPHGAVPTFLIRAVKDPVGANLDRVQLVKGWRDKNGGLHERIYEVALSDQRTVPADGKVKSVGSSVDIENARYTNSLGDPELSVVWKDPDFNKNDFAFYYLRVLEIPTPRWTAYDVKRFDIPDANIPKEIPMVLQERAYSSPIWYTP